MKTAWALMVVTGAAWVSLAAAPAFTVAPKAARDGGQVKISFTVTAASDVEVAVLDAGGKVVRHLAAGMLGRNAPDPLKPDALAQQLVWDGKDDAGRPVAGSCSVRVRLGATPRVEKLFGYQPGGINGAIEALFVSPAGEIYVLASELNKFGRADLLVFDRNLKYLRTIMPYAATTPKERTESVGHFLIEGQRVPILYSGHAGSVYPLTCGLRSQTMAWHPKGYFVAVSSLGTAREHGPARHLLAFDPNGGAPSGVPFVGPKLLEARGFLGGGGERYCRGVDRVAISPDGQFVYVVPHFDGSKLVDKLRKHGVYRVKWDEVAVGDPWLGKSEAGSDDDHFNDPQGIAVDAAGRLLVCDRGNNRVKVYSPEGKLLGKFAADLPEQIAVEPKSGRIIVLSRAPDAKATKSTLLAFAPFKDGAADKLFAWDTKAVRCMALDATGPAPRVWVSVVGGYLKPDILIPVGVGADKFEPGDPAPLTHGLQLPSFLVADPDRNRLIVKEHLEPASSKPFQTIDLASGKMAELPIKSADIALDREGNIYSMDGIGRNSLSRYDPAGKPLPFVGAPGNKIELIYRSFGPDEGLRGHCIGVNGDIYVIRSVGHYVGASLDVFSPDGKLKKAGLVAGIGAADSGLGVDARGNVYVGMNIKDPVRPFAEPFNDLVPKTGWIFWKKGKTRERPWSYTYCNPYLFNMGSVFKFGPEGGTVYGQQKADDKVPITSPGTELEKAPANAKAFKTSCMTLDVKVVGAKWNFPGVGPIPASLDGPCPDPGCSCMPSHFTTDLYGRTFAPNAFRYAVDVIDANGNLVQRIGQYGNLDDAVPGSQASVYFESPTACAVSDGRLYVSDAGNHQIVGLSFQYAAEATVPVP
jgi:sugar lactone lactonase YvrE